VWLGRPLPNG